MLFEEVEGVDPIFPEASVECERRADDGSQYASVFGKSPASIEIGKPGSCSRKGDRGRN